MFSGQPFPLKAGSAGCVCSSMFVAEFRRTFGTCGAALDLPLAISTWVLRSAHTHVYHPRCLCVVHTREPSRPSVLWFPPPCGAEYVRNARRHIKTRQQQSGLFALLTLTTTILVVFALCILMNRPDLNSPSSPRMLKHALGHCPPTLSPCPCPSVLMHARVSEEHRKKGYSYESQQVNFY